MIRWAFAVAVALPLCLVGELLPIRSYSTGEGLASNSIGKIVADSRGFIWFCTPEGLSRFDGYRFVNFGDSEGLKQRFVRVLLETRGGEYLAGTPDGLIQFRAEDGGKFTTYLPGGDAHENAVNALLQDSAGRIWCGTGGGLFELVSGHRFRRQPLAPPPGHQRVMVTSLMEDLSHRLWVGTRLGIYVVGSDGAAKYIEMPGATENVRALLQDRYGKIWAATQDGLVAMRDADKEGKFGIQQIYREAGGVRGLDVTSLAEGPDGNLWAGASAGIVEWLPGSPTPSLRMLTRAQGLIDRQVNSLARDRAGDMWAGTEAAGAMKILHSGFTTFREQDGLATDRVWSVFKGRGGTILAVTASESVNDAVNLFDGARFHAGDIKGFNKQASWGHNILLQARTGVWWAATQAGLWTYAATPGGTLPSGEPEARYARDRAVYQVFEDSKGRIWASARVLRGGGLEILRWDPATNTASFVQGGPSGKDPVYAIGEDRDGNIWIAMPEDMYRYDGRQFTRFTAKDGVPPGISDLYVDGAGRMWLASDKGLDVIDHPGSPHFGVRLYRTTDGLSSDSVVCITGDATGRIYGATVKGVDRLDPRTGYIKQFSVADGLARGNVTSAVSDDAGNLWFATTQGLSRLSPTADRPPTRPSIRITDLRIGRERYPVSPVGETRIRRGDLQPSQNLFQAAFVGFSDEPETNLRYTYTLEGGESGWLKPGTDHEVNYPGLEPGNYHFLVKAVNSEGRESETPAEIDFTILPPVWGRWWFRLAALLVFAALLYGAYRYNLERLLEVERVRTRIATDLHDDIGSSLSGMALLSEAVKQQVDGARPEAFEMASEVAAMARGLARSLSDVVWSTDPRRDDLRNVITRVRQSAAVLEAQGIAWSLEEPAEPQKVKLTPEQRHHLFLIFKEALNNIARHAKCASAKLTIAVEDGRLRAEIVDDGRGFGEAGDQGNGLHNMKLRAEQMGGRLSVAAAPGRGVRLELTVPLK